MKTSLSARCAVIVTVLIASSMVSRASACPTGAPCGGKIVVNPESEEPSWIFRQSTYTHDPMTGARVAQYMRTPPVEPLDDERAVTSRYRRSRTNLRGADGSIDTYYEVQAWGNGRGGIDAEWERFHDAWKESYLQNGYYNQQPAYGQPWGRGGHGNGWGGPGWGQQGPGWGGPGPGGGGWGNGGPGWGGPGWSGGYPGQW